MARTVVSVPHHQLTTKDHCSQSSKLAQLANRKSLVQCEHPPIRARSKWVDKHAAFCVHESTNGDSFHWMQQLEVWTETMNPCMFAPQTLAFHGALLLRNQVSTALDHLLHVPCNKHMLMLRVTSQVLDAQTHPVVYVKYQLGSSPANDCQPFTIMTHAYDD